MIMALLNSQMVPLGTPAHDFNLPGVDGKMHSLDGYMEINIVVIIFMCNHCPYVKAVLQRLIDLQNQYLDGSVQLIGINSNDAVKYPDDSFENMKKIAEEKKIPFPYLFDETQDVARKYDAVCTPDIYVYGMERKLLYRGRIDDNWEHPEKVTQKDLQNAINCILSYQDVDSNQISSMGCSIKWK
jgi:peroxiredoxin